MSDEFGGQFSRSSNPFSENQFFERIELCAGAFRYLAAIFCPKTSGNRLSCKICKYLIEFIVPQTFWRHFRPSWAIKPQSINFFRQIFGFPINSSFPFRYWVNDGLIFVCEGAVPKLFRPKTAHFARKFWELKRVLLPKLFWQVDFSP